MTTAPSPQCVAITENGVSSSYLSGSIPGTLHAGATPTLLREPPQRAASVLSSSARALELCAFAARDNAWLVRRQHGFSG